MYPPLGKKSVGNSLDKLRHPRSDAYSAEQVLLNKQQIWCGGAYPDCYPQNLVIILRLCVHFLFHGFKVRISVGLDGWTDRELFSAMFMESKRSVALRCDGSIRSCRIERSKWPMQANCRQLDRCCSAYHRALFWGLSCTFCTPPNSNRWSRGTACVYINTRMTANFIFMWQSVTLQWQCSVSPRASVKLITGCVPADWDSIQPRRK